MITDAFVAFGMGTLAWLSAAFDTLSIRRRGRRAVISMEIRSNVLVGTLCWTSAVGQVLDQEIWPPVALYSAVGIALATAIVALIRTERAHSRGRFR